MINNKACTQTPACMIQYIGSNPCRHNNQLTTVTNQHFHALALLFQYLVCYIAKQAAEYFID